MYWSGDLAYRDADGFVYFAGRTADWLRVDGENLAAAPIERILLRHPAVDEAAVYAVPDDVVGDQVMAALVLARRRSTPGELEAFLADAARPGPKGWPRYVRIVATLPRTATNKVLKRELRAEGLGEGTRVWTRAERGTYVPRLSLAVVRRAAVYTVVFFFLAPGTMAGLVPWLITQLGASRRRCRRRSTCSAPRLVVLRPDRRHRVLLALRDRGRRHSRPGRPHPGPSVLDQFRDAAQHLGDRLVPRRHGSRDTRREAGSGRARSVALPVKQSAG